MDPEPNVDVLTEVSNTTDQIVDVYGDPLSESTHHRQNWLLAASVISILVHFSIIESGPFAVGEVKLKVPDEHILEVLAGVTTCYFLLVYILSAWREIECFRLRYSPKILKMTSAGEKLAATAVAQLKTDLAEKLEKYRKDFEEGKRLIFAADERRDEKWRLERELIGATLSAEERQKLEASIQKASVEWKEAEAARNAHSKAQSEELHTLLETFQKNPENLSPREVTNAIAQINYRASVLRKALLVDRVRVFIEVVIPVVFGLVGIFLTLIWPAFGR